MHPWWSEPEVVAVGRLPIAPELPSYGCSDDARNGRAPFGLSLDGPWRFRLERYPAALPEGWFDADTDDGDECGWTTLTVPGAWSLPRPGEQAHDAPGYTNVVMPFDADPPSVPADNPTGLYRRTFRVPAAWKGRRVELSIGSAESVVMVWVNGAFIGVGKDSRLPSTFDLTAALRRGVNVVALAVVQWSDASWLEDQDQWWLGGLHRSVELTATPLTWLADVGLIPGLCDDLTTGTLDVDVRVDGPVAPDGWTVGVVVETLAGRRVASLGRSPVSRFEHGEPLTELISGMFFEGQVVRARLEIPGIVAWSHERPERYRVIVELRDPDGTVVDVRTQLTGFRSVVVAGNELRVNGQPVEILGVNLHEFDPDLGRVVDEASLRRDLQLMKAHHLNAVRFAHYPHHRTAYDLCDELGLYVIDEANVESHARQASLCHDPRYHGAIVDRGVRMVRRSRNHPCVVSWSLGNESGYGAAHDAMAAAIRRLDPSRPLHYEGVVMHDLYAEGPVSDIVAPMYPAVADIVAWAESGRDTRRPLIMCEFSHAMGTSNGSLADYVEAVRSHHGLQGGFIWEWVDHGIRRRVDDGTEWFAYGGDFDEDRRWGRHDGNFCCDGLVSPDRVPHPAMAELAKLAQSVTARPAPGRRALPRVRIENRRWFSDLSDLRCRWERLRDGAVVERGELEMPVVAPRSSELVAVPGTVDADSLVLQWSPRRRPSWAPKGWTAGWAQIDLRSSAEHPPARPRKSVAASVSASSVASTTDDGRVLLGDIEIAAPELCLWRAPTDNDGIQIGWMAGVGARGHWVRSGLDRLAVHDSEVRPLRGGRGVRRTTVWRSPVDDLEVVHHQRIVAEAATLQFVERVDIPASFDDLPRVGVRFELPPSFDRLEWMGPGPHETYPDRCLAQRRRWTSTVGDQYVELVHPQEHGHHHDTAWLTVGDGRLRLDITAGRRFGCNVSRYSVEELTAAAHTTDLPTGDPTATHVHIDVAHRGLGTASCGPDVLPPYLVAGGRRTWNWSITC